MVFAPACYDHGLVEFATYDSIKIRNGDDGNMVSAWQQLLDFMANDFGNRTIGSVQSDCIQGVNCEASCRPIEIGSHTYC